MKSRITSCLIFLSTLPVLSFAQQITATTARELTPTQQFEAQRGKVENFKTLAYRFEVAWEEADLQSMVDLKNGLSGMMKAENEAPAPAFLNAEKADENLPAKKQCLLQVDKIPLATNDAAFGKKAEQLQKLFQDYIKLMEGELTAQLESLRKMEKE